MAVAFEVKKLKKPKEALAPLKSGQVVMVGGFGLSGTPITLLYHLLEMPIKDLTIISNNLGKELGLGKLLLNGQIKKAIGSYFTSNRDAIELWKKVRWSWNCCPKAPWPKQFGPVERVSAAFNTPTAVGTELAKGKEGRIIDGKGIFLKRL